ncbi:MAG TPA: DUF6483 family protein [Ktedonobacteraceae bacterium]
MAQRDYILRMFEEMSRAIAQIVYQREMKDYHASHELIDQQFRQTLGMGSGFIQALSDETLLALLTTLGVLNTEKCWLVALLLKAEGDLHADEHDESKSYYSYLKACNLFLEALYNQNHKREIEKIVEIEALLNKLEEYELPLRTKQLLFWYFEFTNRYGKAEDLLFAILEEETDEAMETTEGIESMDEMRIKGRAFYARLLSKNDSALESGDFSRTEVKDGLARLQQLSV